MTNIQMKKSNLILLFAFAVLVLLTLSFQLSVHGYVVKGENKDIGAFIDQDRSLPPYTAMNVSGNIKVLFTQDQRASLLVRAPKNAMDSVKTIVKDNELQIHKNIRVYGTDTITIVISNPKLEAVALDTNAHLNGMNTISGDSLSLTVKGKSKLSMQLAYRLVHCTKDKASQINLQGDTRKINFITTE